MNNIEKYKKILEKMLNWPWRVIGYCLLASFVVATIFSLIVSVVLRPQVSQAKKTSRQAIIDVNLDWVVQTLNKQQVDAIVKRNIFNKTGEYPDEDTKSENIEEGESETKLPLVLLGVISGGNIYNGIVIIKNTSKNVTESYLVDDLIQPYGARITEIYPKKVYIFNDKREFLTLKEKPIIRSRRIAKKRGGSSSFKLNNARNEYKEDGFERIGNKVRISDSYRQSLLTSQLSRVLQDAKAEPFMKDGEVLGWKMVNIKKNSIYEKMGMKDGDVVREINGVPLTDAGKAIKTLNKMRKESKYQIKIDRGGSAVDMSLDVSGGS